MFVNILKTSELYFFFETESCHIAQDGTHNPPALASQVLGLQACAITPGFELYIFKG
jgi:hypothetical protein